MKLVYSQKAGELDFNVRTFLRRAGLALTLFALLATASSRVVGQDDAFTGFWTTSNLTSIVEITACDSALCAEIVWLWDVSVAGRKMLDKKNPQESKQKNSLVGRQLFSRFNKDGDRWQGRIYNPEDGRTYRASVTGARQECTESERLLGAILLDSNLASFANCFHSDRKRS